VKHLKRAVLTFPGLQQSILSLKSWLFTAAATSDRFGRAADVHADSLIVDLEDAVAPSANAAWKIERNSAVGKQTSKQPRGSDFDSG
jgi:(S)-citramalyl-CoA lyase